MRADRSLLAGLLLSLAASAPAPAMDPEAAGARFEAERRRHEIPALAVVLVDGDRVVWQAVFGSASLDGRRSLTVHTPFRVGSVGKIFNALAVMRAGAWGKGLLDTPLVELDRRFSLAGPEGPAMTLRMLLAHTGGVVREPPVGHYLQAGDPGLEATLASLAPTCRVYPPGTKIKYSNAGVTIAGGVLEKLAQRPYREAVHDLVFAALGMDDAGFGVPPGTVEGVRHLPGRGDVPAPRFAIGMVPAGDMVASVEDLGTFLRALFRALDDAEDAVLDGAMLDRMMRPYFEPDRERWQMEVGLGFVLHGDFEGTPMARHGGGVYGFNAEFAVLPEARLGVAVLSAREGTLGVAQNLGHHLLRLLLAERRGLPAPPFEPVETLYGGDARLAALRAVPADDVPRAWRRLLGFYGYEHGGIEVLSDGEALLASVEGGAPRPLDPVDGTTFRFGRFDDYGEEWLRFLVRDGEVAGLAVGSGVGFTLVRSGYAGTLPPTASLPCPSDGE